MNNENGAVKAARAKARTGEKSVKAPSKNGTEKAAAQSTAKNQGRAASARTAKGKTAAKTTAQAPAKTAAKPQNAPRTAAKAPRTQAAKNTAKAQTPDKAAPKAAAKQAVKTVSKAVKGRGRKAASKLKIIPLGGLEQIGMNITAFEYEDDIVVVDCGLSFPEDDMLGIDLVIPDVTYLKENISKVRGFVITHGHEDHIGALPYTLKEVNVPIYSTKLTLGLISNKLKEHNLLRTTKMKEVTHGQVINLGAFSIEFIKTNHSIQDASALAIYSPAGIVVHTGDFKVDYTPVFGDAIDLQRFAEIGKKGVLALMCDSTNAERKGFTMSERTVGRVFDNLFNEYKNTRIIIATFASNVDRVQQIINSAYKFGRKVAVEGRSMVNVITTAAELGYLKIPDQTLIEIDQLKNYPDDKVTLITTGSQGESMAALSRMAASIHRKVTIKPGDTIIFSSNPIPGNEKAVSKVINELSMKGANVIFQDAHVSGHACQEEIKLIYSLVHPKYAIPVHGEYRHLVAHARVAEEIGIPKDDIFILQSGEVLELDNKSAAVSGKVQTGGILVDGLGVGDVGNIVLRDRQHLAEDGIMIVVMTLERYSNSVLAGPDIVSRGFVYVRESEDLMDQARTVVEDALQGCLDNHISDWGKLKTVVKDALGDFLWKRTKRRPMILPIIMEA
ncbi:MAG: RNase J family beta-CASP ribonuclease [Blautia sp.]